jgi:hypothetical protein
MAMPGRTHHSNITAALDGVVKAHTALAESISNHATREREAREVAAKKLESMKQLNATKPLPSA